MKLLSVRGGAFLLIGSVVAGLSAQAHAGWGHRHASVGGSSGVYAVGYGSSGTARFYGQIVTKRMGSPGDSGSLVLDLYENAIGLLFAGSSTHTIINHIVFVQNLLGIRVV